MENPFEYGFVVSGKAFCGELRGRNSGYTLQFSFLSKTTDGSGRPLFSQE